MTEPEPSFDSGLAVQSRRGDHLRFVALGLAVVIAAGAITYLALQSRSEDPVKAAEQAYQQANPPYVPPPPAPIIVVPESQSGPQFGWEAGPAGAQAPKAAPKS